MNTNPRIGKRAADDDDQLEASKTKLQAALRPAPKVRRMTRSVAARQRAATRGELFDRMAAPILSSGFLRWYEAENLAMVTKSCHATWREQRESYEGWSDLLRELNVINCTNRCCHCEQVILLKSNRACCTVEKWNDVSAERTPDFLGVIDIIMSNGILNWREKGSIRRICKTCYTIHRDQCTCRQHNRTAFIGPFVGHDPRYRSDFRKLSDYKKCRALVDYTSWMIRNLHSFYDFQKITDPSKLPYGLVEKPWMDIQMLTLQRACPGRYAFVMNLVSLYLAQGELQRSPPTWYATAFLGENHDPVQNPAYEECLGAGISQFCLPATDEVLIRFLRTKCYPPPVAQEKLGPLVSKLSIFAPFFGMVPLDSTKEAKLPPKLEVLSDEMIDNMSFQIFCTIS